MRLAPLLVLGATGLLFACGGEARVRGDGPPRVVRERAAELRRIPLPLEGLERLRFEDFDGSVTIVATERGVPEMRAHLRTVADDPARAEAILASLEVAMEREEESLIVRLEQPEEGPWLTSSSYELFVPAGLVVSVENESGDVEIRGALGSVSVITSFGNVMVSGTNGNVSVETLSGRVDVERVESKRVDVASKHGDISLRYVRGRRVTATSAAGDVGLEWVHSEVTRGSSNHGVVEAVGLEGSAHLSTRDSELLLEALPGTRAASLRIGRSEVSTEGGSGLLDITADFGRVAVNDFEGTVVVDSSHGNVSIGGVLDEVRASSRSGTLSVAAREGSTAQRKWRLRAGSGNVVLALPATFACRLDARTEKGAIRSDFDVVLEPRDGLHRHGSLRGELNGGGRPVSVRSDSGRIRIQRSGS